MERAEAEALAEQLSELLEAVSLLKGKSEESTAEERESESEVAPAQTADSSAAEAHEGEDEGEVPPAPAPGAADAAAATPAGESFGMCSIISPSLGPVQSPVWRLCLCASASSIAQKWKRTLGHQTIPSAPRATSEW